MGWGLGHARSSHTAFSNPTDPVSAASALSLLGYPACSCRLRPSSRARPYRCLLAGLSPGVMNSINPTGPLQIRRSGRLNQEETGEAIKNSSTILRVPTTCAFKMAIWKCIREDKVNGGLGSDTYQKNTRVAHGPLLVLPNPDRACVGGTLYNATLSFVSTARILPVGDSEKV